MEQNALCPICFDRFTSPKMLLCRHTFCLQCLKDFTNENSSKRRLRCPVCRAKVALPNGGIDQMPSNYFASSCKTPNETKNCLTCQSSDLKMTECNMCSSSFCAKCFEKHFHQQENSESSDDETDPGTINIPLHTVMLGIQTGYECKQETHFVVDIPQDDNNNHKILSICLSKSGGLFVVPLGVMFLLKYDQNGRVLDKIRTPFQCSGIAECQNGVSILGAFINDKVILKYELGGWSNFTVCSNFHPADILELSNGCILVCGADQIHSVVDGFVKTGHIQMYSPHGEILLKLDEAMGNTRIFSFPHKMAYNKGTIAVTDKDTNCVVFFKEYDEQNFKVFKGQGGLRVPLPLGLDHQFNLNISGVCRGHGENFIVSTPQGYLLFIDCCGKLRGLGMTNAEDRFGQREPQVVQDSNGIIWTSDSLFGSIKTFKMVRCKNKFSDACLFA